MVTTQLYLNLIIVLYYIFQYYMVHNNYELLR